MSRDATTAAQQFYGRWAGLYDVLARTAPGLGQLRGRVADTLRLSPGDTVVEMGCGTGANFPHLRERIGSAGRLVGVDFTRPMLESARRRVRRAGWENVDLVQADVTAVELCDRVDAVLATFVVGMLADPAGAVDRWFGMLEPGGHLALLDAGQSDRGYAWPLNQAFRGLVVASSPDGARPRYEEPPWDVLDRRIAAARRAMDDRGRDVAHSEHALGIVRITSAQAPPRH